MRTIDVIGSGRVGSAVAARLRERGVGVGSPDPELIVLCVPDAAIAEVAAGIAPGPWVAHVSGATPLAALAPHERRFSVHPLQTFTRSRGPEQLDGAWAAVTGETGDAVGAGDAARRAARSPPVRARRLRAHALPRRRSLRVELRRRAPARGVSPLRVRRRSAGGARAAHAADDRERLRADGPDLAR